MKNIKYIIGLSLLVNTVIGGNPQRSGQGGSTELLTNPWTRTAGYANANGASVRGLESQFLNIGGLARINKTELVFNRTNLYGGAGININSFGFAQRVGETGALAVSLNNTNYGEINITNVENPDGGIGTYKASHTAVNVSYAKGFSNSIYGGFNVKFVNVGYPSVRANGVAIDAGVQYHTGLGKDKKDNLHFGIALKNWGPALRFNGDALSFRGLAASNGYVAPGGNVGTTITVQQRSQEFEMPSLLNISAVYDIDIADKIIVSPALNFIANAFTPNQFCAGAELNYDNIVKLRGGYIYQNRQGDAAELFNGVNAGASVDVPLNKEKTTKLGLDFSYRWTVNLRGVLGFGLRLNI